MLHLVHGIVNAPRIFNKKQSTPTLCQCNKPHLLKYGMDSDSAICIPANAEGDSLTDAHTLLASVFPQIIKIEKLT